MSSKKSKIILPDSYVLPSNNSELELFSKKFKNEMIGRVVDIIEFAVKNKLSFIEAFQFKNSNFVITLSKEHYTTNLDNAYSYYIEREMYECCSKILQLKTLIKKTLFNDENKTITTK